MFEVKARCLLASKSDHFGRMQGFGQVRVEGKQMISSVSNRGGLVMGWACVKQLSCRISEDTKGITRIGPVQRTTHP